MVCILYRKSKEVLHLSPQERMPGELEFEKPKRLLDTTTGGYYFLFQQKNTSPPYTISWDPVEELTVPEDIMNSILECYLQFASSYFVKAPTIEQMKKRISNLLTNSGDASRKTEILTLVPDTIRIFSKKTDVYWAVSNFEPKDEQIPSDFLESSRSSSPLLNSNTKNIIITSDPVQNSIMEAVADIPLQENGINGTFRLDDDSDERMYRLRVLEAKLSAKLARYRVKKEEDKYHSRFGQRLRLSDDEYSVNDEDSEDDEEDDST